MPNISFSVAHFSSCPQSFPASGSFPMNWLFASGGQSTGASASASVLPMNIQGRFPLGLTGLISLLSKGLSIVFSNTIVQKHQFFGAQSSCSTSFLGQSRQSPRNNRNGFSHSSGDWRSAMKVLVDNAPFKTLGQGGRPLQVPGSSGGLRPREAKVQTVSICTRMSSLCVCVQDNYDLEFRAHSTSGLPQWLKW